MALDPIAKAILEQLAAGPALHTMSVEQARNFMVEHAKMSGPGEPVASVEDKAIKTGNCDVTIRIYTPAGEGPFPIYVYFHGGGWTVGNLDTDDFTCRIVCNAAKCIVASVNYRHAPEFKFPTAVDDAYGATCWIAERASEFNGDASRLAVGGTSAGGNLAAVISQLARESKVPNICLQVLIVPALDCAANMASHAENAQGYGLERATMDWFCAHYLRSAADFVDALASPLRAANFAGLPPAFILTAQYDPLRDEGRAYAERLQQAGVPVTYACCAGMTHLYQGPDALKMLLDSLKVALGSN